MKLNEASGYPRLIYDYKTSEGKSGNESVGVNNFSDNVKGGK